MLVDGRLDKAGKLDGEEWKAMQMHAAYTEAILSRIAAFRDLAAIAGAHHERLDRQGLSARAQGQ